MICISISHNGNQLCVVGHQKADMLQANVVIAPDGGAPGLVNAHASVREAEEHKVWLTWPELQPVKVSVGDTVSVKVLESDTPSVGSTEFQSGRKTTSTGVELFCSWCSKSEKEVKKMIAGPKVQICDECVTLCGEILQSNAP